MKYFANLLVGNNNAEIKTYKGNESPFFSSGAEEDVHFWHAVFRQIVVLGFVKEIETYGTLILTEKGEEFINNPKGIDLVKEHDFSDTDDKDIILNQAGGGALDEKL